MNTELKDWVFRIIKSKLVIKNYEIVKLSLPYTILTPILMVCNNTEFNTFLNASNYSRKSVQLFL